MKRNILMMAGLIVLFVACSAEQQHQKTEVDTVKVMVVEAVPGYQTVNREYSGTITAETTSRIGTKIMGRIEALPWQEGDYIEKGEVLFRVENGELKARKAGTKSKLSEASAHKNNTRINYERISNLHKKGSATQKEMDDMVTAYKASQAQVEALESAVIEIDRLLAQSIIRAPYSGYLTRKFMQRGDMISPGQPVVALESFKQLKVHARVPESEISNLRKSDTVSVVIKAVGATVKGKITQINPSSRFSSIQYQATVLLQIPDSLKKAVKSGMYAKVLVHKKGQQTLTIPVSTLVKKGQLSGIYTINSQGRIALRWIRTGRSANGRVEVLSGLTAGEQYISHDSGHLKEGQPVIIENRN